jgi:SAM-dependent methyltransferase
MRRSSLSGDIVPELSAVANRPCPRSIRKAAPRLASEADRVADVGCGYMAGTVELLRHHKKVYAVDTGRQEERIRHQIDACSANPRFAGFRTTEEFARSRLRLGGVYVVNVLHTLPTPAARVRLLESARRNLRTGGFVLIDVPSFADYYRGRLRPENAFGDGYVFQQGTGKFTFYRFSRPEELDSWAAAAGLTFDFGIVDNHHWVRVYRSSKMS